MILAGDVGGTKTILALYEREGDAWRCIEKSRYASADYPAFSGLLADFLAESGKRTIDAVCLGVAGPIVDGDCVATNLPWVLRRAEIGEAAGTGQVRLLNDLEATAWGILALPDGEFVDLNPDASVRPGNVAVLAAGTGLGEAIVAWDGENLNVLATEGGHSDFAPASEQEIALLRYLWQKHPDHVSYERLLSGEGLTNVYRFLQLGGFAATNPDIEQRMRDQDPAAVIGEAGVEGSDALCVEALTWFCRIYGAEAGNLALKCLPYAGVYLAGGIAAKILPFIKRGDFMAGYLAKGRYRAALQQIPVKVCTNQEVALLGALAVGARTGAG